MSILQEGQSIRGTYEVERHLGEGAFAEVYRVKHRFLGRQAMKVFKMSGMTMPEVEEMLGEAVILSQIGHPNIVRVFDANVIETSKGVCGFFTMEYVAGGSLEQFWHSHGTQFVPIEKSVEVVLQACRGLAVAHAEKPPVVHRDVKPANILVGYDATGIRVRVSDFGLAKRVNPLTLLATAKGTRPFKGPEAFLDAQSDSCAGDVYGLGATLYLLLTDRLPYSDLSDSTGFDSSCFKRPIVPPSRLNILVDPGLESIILKALAPNPKDRYPTAKELLVDISQRKPRQLPLGSKQPASGLSEGSKTSLGRDISADEGDARKMASKAIKLARQAGKLNDAADMMEEAFNRWPGLRGDYEYQLKLWRRGLVM